MRGARRAVSGTAVRARENVNNYEMVNRQPSLPSGEFALPPVALRPIRYAVAPEEAQVLRELLVRLQPAQRPRAHDRLRRVLGRVRPEKQLKIMVN